MKENASVAFRWLGDRANLFANDVISDVKRVLVFLLTMAIDMIESFLVAILVTIIVAAFGWVTYKTVLVFWDISEWAWFVVVGQFFTTLNATTCS
jgi:hypothetical protein